MGTTELLLEKHIEEAIHYQNKKHIKLLPEEEKKEINNIRKKIKRMSEKCQT